MIRREPVLALAGKELCSWFFSPLFYGTGIFLILFLSIWLYYLQAFYAMNSAGFRPFFTGFLYVFIPVIPVITMKSWADEKKTGTSELLFTIPVTEWELCIAKFISSFFVLLIYVLLSLFVPVTLLPLAKFDIGVLVTEIAGVILLGAFCVSIGLFCSGMSKNQASAFLSCTVFLIILIFIDRFAMAAGFFPVLARFFGFLSLFNHFESFSRGLLDSRDLVFFLGGTAFFLFLNTRSLTFRMRS